MKFLTEFLQKQFLKYDYYLSFCIDVILAVPKSSEDKVILHESISKKFILEFEICRIIFFARGTTGSPEQSCFAFTCAHQDEESRKTIFQCHIFRCQVIIREMKFCDFCWFTFEIFLHVQLFVYRSLKQ